MEARVAAMLDRRDGLYHAMQWRARENERGSKTRKLFVGVNAVPQGQTRREVVWRWARVVKKGGVGGFVWLSPISWAVYYISLVLGREPL
jgi:hypothetical protein